MRDCATGGQSGVLAMTMEVDGVPIRGLESPATTPYRVTTPIFTYELPEGSIYDLFGFDLPAQTAWSAGDGVYVILAPLPAGEHIIRSTAQFNGGFAIDTTYHLTVGADCE